MNKIKSKKGIRYWMKKADEIFSLYIRLRDTNEEGFGVCYTCGKKVFYKRNTLGLRHGECGHYVSRVNKSLRYDETNCHIQCYYCNEQLRGNFIEYRKHLIKEFGEKVVEDMEFTQSDKITALQLEEIYELYKIKVEELLTNKLFRR